MLLMSRPPWCSWWARQASHTAQGVASEPQHELSSYCLLPTLLAPMASRRGLVVATGFVFLAFPYGISPAPSHPPYQTTLAAIPLTPLARPLVASHPWYLAMGSPRGISLAGRMSCTNKFPLSAFPCTFKETDTCPLPHKEAYFRPSRCHPPPPLPMPSPLPSPLSDCPHLRLALPPPPVAPTPPRGLGIETVTMCVCVCVRVRV